MQKFKMLAKQVGETVYEGDGGCVGGSCPAMIRQDGGKVVVVGKLLKSSDQSALDSSGLVKIYEDEQAVLIDEKMLLAAVKVLKSDV